MSQNSFCQCHRTASVNVTVDSKNSATSICNRQVSSQVSVSKVNACCPQPCCHMWLSRPSLNSTPCDTHCLLPLQFLTLPVSYRYPYRYRYHCCYRYNLVTHLTHLTSHPSAAVTSLHWREQGSRNRCNSNQRVLKETTDASWHAHSFLQSTDARILAIN